MTTIDERIHAKCGTTAGYCRHQRYGEPTCEPCRAARREYMRNRPAVSPRKQSVMRQEEALARVRLPEALEPGDCWEWPGTRQAGRGYGLLAPSVSVCGSELAHRSAYTLAFGDIPPGMSVCHRCDNPPCYRPSHLFLGTHDDNMKDMARKGRSNRLVGFIHPMSRLTAQDIERTQQLYGEGWSTARIARDFGVHPATIQRVLRGKSYDGIGRVTR